MNLGEYLDKADGHTAANLARTVKAAPALISQWRNNVRPIPIDRCPDIERATDGNVPCEELRPDVVWVRVPDPDWPHPQGRPLVDHTTKVSQAGAADEKAAA